MTVPCSPASLWCWGMSEHDAGDRRAPRAACMLRRSLQSQKRGCRAESCPTVLCSPVCSATSGSWRVAMSSNVVSAPGCSGASCGNLHPPASRVSEPQPTLCGCQQRQQPSRVDLPRGACSPHTQVPALQALRARALHSACVGEVHTGVVAQSGLRLTERCCPPGLTGHRMTPACA